MKIKTNELTGADLNWAVAKCEGLNPNINYDAPKKYGLGLGWREADGFGKTILNYSTNWAHGGPIIERENIGIIGNIVSASLNYRCAEFQKENAKYYYYGDTVLIAAMRCYVASKLGDEVEIPEELNR